MKITCLRCCWKGESEELLKGLNPFEPIMTIEGCPVCKNVDSCVPVCEQERCWKQATCGTPTPDGSYKSTCVIHKPQHPPLTDKLKCRRSRPYPMKVHKFEE